MVEKKHKKTNKKVASESEARRGIIEDLFQDFNRSRVQVYKMNFIRGLFFGLGSVLGGTILVALAVWLLSVLGQYIPFFSDFFKAVTEVLNR